MAAGSPGSEGAALPPPVPPQQLILYQDKATAAMDKHEEKIKFKKARKRKPRQLTDNAAYNHGKRDAETVVLGTKKLKASA